MKKVSELVDLSNRESVQSFLRVLMNKNVIKKEDGDFSEKDLSDYMRKECGYNTLGAEQKKAMDKEISHIFKFLCQPEAAEKNILNEIIKKHIKPTRESVSIVEMMRNKFEGQIIINKLDVNVNLIEAIATIKEDQANIKSFLEDILKENKIEDSDNVLAAQLLWLTSAYQEAKVLFDELGQQFDKNKTVDMKDLMQKMVTLLDKIRGHQARICFTPDELDVMNVLRMVTNSWKKERGEKAWGGKWQDLIKLYDSCHPHLTPYANGSAIRQGAAIALSNMPSAFLKCIGEHAAQLDITNKEAALFIVKGSLRKTATAAMQYAQLVKVWKLVYACFESSSDRQFFDEVLKEAVGEEAWCANHASLNDLHIHESILNACVAAYERQQAKEIDGDTCALLAKWKEEMTQAICQLNKHKDGFAVKILTRVDAVIKKKTTNGENFSVKNPPKQPSSVSEETSKTDGVAVSLIKKFGSFFDSLDNVKEEAKQGTTQSFTPPSASGKANRVPQPAPIGEQSIFSSRGRADATAVPRTELLFPFMRKKGS